MELKELRGILSHDIFVLMYNRMIHSNCSEGVPAGVCLA